MLYFWMHHFLSRIDISIGDQVFNIPLESLQSEGFSEEEGILPYPKNVYQGYRVLHEYLVYPDAFLFFKLLLLVGKENMTPTHTIQATIPLITAIKIFF